MNHNPYLKLLILSILLTQTLTQLTIEPIKSLVSKSAKTHEIPKNFKDIVTCLCDQTINVCDLLCCCDTQCTQAEVTKWTENKICKQQSNAEFENLEFPKCSSWRDNPSSPNIYQNQINSITCIFHENVPYQGHFYPQIDSNVAPLESELEVKQHISDKVDQNFANLSTAYLGGKTNLIHSTNKLFTLPSRDAFGSCNNETPIKYLTPYSQNCIHKFLIN